MSKRWSQEEVDFLINNYGYLSIPFIAKKLNRSVKAVNIKKARLHLGAFLDNGDYVTLNQLFKILKIAVGSYYKTSWVQKRKLPVHRKKVNNNTFRVIYIDEFWKWAEKNRSFLDFSKMEENALGEEPEWVKEKRRMDYKYSITRTTKPWTTGEDEKLKYLLKQYKYTYPELSDIMHRSEGAIQRRCVDLNIKERPLKVSASKWTTEELLRLEKGIRSGQNYLTIAKAVGKSEKAIRGKVYQTYLTENLDKVRAILKNCKWGENMPVPTVQQGMVISAYRTQTKKSVMDLIMAVQFHIKQEAYVSHHHKASGESGKEPQIKEVAI